MSIVFFMASLALVPYFASRAFLPLFATACVARFGPQVEFLGQLAGVQVLEPLPAPLTSDTALVVLLGLALVEIVATKVPEVRGLFQVGDPPFKAAAAAVLVGAMAYGGVDELRVATLELGFPVAALTTLGESLVQAWALVVGAMVWLTAVLRNAIWGVLMEIDEADDLRLQALLAWLEDALGVVGVIVVVVMPSVALALAGLTLAGLWLTKRILVAREEKQKVSCDSCAVAFPACGLQCPSCAAPRLQVREVGWLGTIRDGLAADRERHRLALLGQKRCGRCGERLAGRRVDNACRSCGRAAFTSVDELEIYLASVRTKLPKVLAILFVLGWVPLLGLVVGVIYYRLSVLSSVRCYIPRSTGLLARWIARGCQFVLVCLQPIPIVGAFTLPLLCLVSYGVYGKLLRRHARQSLVDLPPLPLPMGA